MNLRLSLSAQVRGHPYRILCEIVIQGVLQLAQFLLLLGLGLFLGLGQPCLSVLLILQGLKETPTKSQSGPFVAAAS